MTHRIEIFEHFADAIQTGEKNFEVRKNTRGYQKGDILEMSVMSVPDDDSYDESQFLGEIKCEVTYVLSGWGIKPGFVVMGIRVVE